MRKVEKNKKLIGLKKLWKKNVPWGFSIYCYYGRNNRTRMKRRAWKMIELK